MEIRQADVGRAAHPLLAKTSAKEEVFFGRLKQLDTGAPRRRAACAHRRTLVARESRMSHSGAFQPLCWRPLLNDDARGSKVMAVTASQVDTSTTLVSTSLR